MSRDTKGHLRDTFDCLDCLGPRGIFALRDTGSLRESPYTCVRACARISALLLSH